MVSNSALKCCLERIRPGLFTSALWPYAMAIGAIAVTPRAWAEDSEYSYVTVGSEVIITGYDCGVSSTVAIIPDTIDGLPVTGVGNEAFASCSALTHVTLGSGVANIGYEAFRSCYALSGVSIPESVVTISAFAFYDCTGLTSVTIPDRVVTVGALAFWNCSAMTDVTIGAGVSSIGPLAFLRCNALNAIQVVAGNSAFSDVDGVLFNQDQTTLVMYPLGRAGSYSIPASVATIGRDSFRGAGGLTQISMGSGVQDIGSSAFLTCRSVTNLTSGAWSELDFGIQEILLPPLGSNM